LALYLVSPFFTVGQYERTVVTRFGQFSSVAAPGLHFRIPFVNGPRSTSRNWRRIGDVALAVHKSLQTEALELFGVTILDFQINDIRYTDQYRQAVDAAAIAKAKVEQSEQERRQAEVNAQRLKIQAEGEANAVREQARGEADGELLLATAQAKGKQLVSLAEAKALKAQGQALASNDALMLEFAKRWSGNLPVNRYAGARFLFPTSHPPRQPKPGADVMAWAASR
jgi:regulator of protease activity HflC (stomatin/prohibitin superfamily)